MAAQKHLPNRRSLRLPGYDYTLAGAYFITIMTYHHKLMFGEVVGEDVRLNPLGKIVQAQWLNTEVLRPEVALDEFVVMPNHFHGIVFILDSQEVRADGRPPVREHEASRRSALHRKPRSLGSIVAGFKSAATKQINQHRKAPGQPVWQRNYYDRIIRNQAELNRIRQYILDNPRRWMEDRENRPTLP